MVRLGRICRFGRHPLAEWEKASRAFETRGQGGYFANSLISQADPAQCAVEMCRASRRVPFVAWGPADEGGGVFPAGV